MRGKQIGIVVATLAAALLGAILGAARQDPPIGALGPGANPALAPLPVPSRTPNPRQVALGRQLFFDPRLSGDSTVACDSCHDPEAGWADGMPLSVGYPGSLYFRNAPTVLNAAHSRYLYWDGRLPASDLATMVRDHISEAHFMYADGRLVIERLRQIPDYERGFKRAFGGEPTYGRILNSVAAFLRTLRSKNVPFDNFLRGDSAAISPAAKRGLELFQRKANCIQCHNGPMLSDDKFYNLGRSANLDIFQSPERHITFRRFFKTLGVARYANLREDVGRFAITKMSEDKGRFLTPTLRELTRTAPYMHDGSLATLEDVVEFYDKGGGPGADKDSSLRPLRLAANEKSDLVEFLKTLSGSPISAGRVRPAAYQVRKLGEN